MLKKSILALMAILATTIAATVPALAHPGPIGHESFLAGLMHPLTGLDHILAMVAVGIWAAQQGGRALWVWPVVFVGTMFVGGALGMAGVPLPFVEPGILASIIVLGLMVALAVRLPVAAGAALVAVFALVHGHAHGTELAGANAILFAAGFGLATSLLHLAGIGLGISVQKLASGPGQRLLGGVVAALGLGLIFTS